ncbi:MAG TPA: YybS family protein, partial [Bacillota bacterium]|nr:YybS family protein [Bacillota bacterium]
NIVKGRMSLRNNVRSMLEGALLSGIFIILMFLTLYSPFGVITAMALSVPFTIYAARHGVKPSLLVVGVSAILTVIIGGALLLVFNALFSGMLGVVMGTLYRQGRKATVVFVGGTLASLVFLLGSLIISNYVFKMNLVASMQSMFNQSIQMSESMLNQIGANDPKQVEMLRSMITLIPKLLPMLLIVGSAQFSIINHWLSRKILQRLGMNVSAFPPFREWSWPKSVMVYYLIVLTASIFLMKEDGMNAFNVILLNIKPILDIMMIIQGLSLVFYFSYVKGYGKGIPIVAFVLVFIFQPFPFILILLGILDIGMDLRKRIVSNK